MTTAEKMARAVLAWWEHAQWEESGGRNPKNRYDDEPDFVVHAKAYLEEIGATP